MAIIFIWMGSFSGLSAYEGRETNGPIILGLPVEVSAFVMSSAFGPRLKASDNFRYDFHRGIDIPGPIGQPCLAVADGSIYNVYPDGSSTYPNSGNVVVVVHEVGQPFLFHDTLVDHYYAVYLHLDSFGPAAQAFLDGQPFVPVLTGDLVGGMGQTGDAAINHLHFEIRYQTTCSLEFQLANPGLLCAGYGFDPHVNFIPLYLPSVDPQSFTLNVEEINSGRILITATALPDVLVVDGFQLEVRDPLTALLYSRTLSFDLRQPFDATSTENLDNPALEGITVYPSPFSTSSSFYEIAFEVQLPPSIWSDNDIVEVTTQLTTPSQIVATEILQLHCISIPVDAWAHLPGQAVWDIDQDGLITVKDYLAVFGCVSFP